MRRRRRLAATPIAEIVHVVNIFNVTDSNLQEELEYVVAEENGSYDFDRSTSSYTFWFSGINEARRFFRFVKSLKIRVVD